MRIPRAPDSSDPLQISPIKEKSFTSIGLDRCSDGLGRWSSTLAGPSEEETARRARGPQRLRFNACAHRRILVERAAIRARCAADDSRHARRPRGDDTVSISLSIPVVEFCHGNLEFIRARKLVVNKAKFALLSLGLSVSMSKGLLSKAAALD